MSKIYSIVSVGKSCDCCQYVHAFSYSRETLEDMIQNIHSDHLEEADYFINEDVSVYFLTKLDEKSYLTKKVGKVGKHPFNQDNLYAFNKITTDGAENCILDISGFNIEDIRDLPLFKNDLSENKIHFDTYYEEGIMNA